MQITSQFDKQQNVNYNGQPAVVLSVKYDKDILYTIYVWVTETTVTDVKENELQP